MDECAASWDGMEGVVPIDQAEIRGQLDQVACRFAEETPNSPLEAEADAQCGAPRYEPAPVSFGMFSYSSDPRSRTAATPK